MKEKEQACAEQIFQLCYVMSNNYIVNNEK